MRGFVSAIALFALVSCFEQDSEWEKPATHTLGCESYQSVVTSDGILYNNVWNYRAAKTYNWQQCLEKKLGTQEPVFGWSWTWPDTGKEIFAYPQIKVGTSPWEPLPKVDDRFPIKLSELDSLLVSHDLDIDADSEFNVATSFWLTDSPDIGDTADTSIIVAEVMVWTYATPGHMRPAGQKIGKISHKGQMWSIWVNKDWGDASGVNDNRWVYVAFESERRELNSQFDIVELMGNDLLKDLNLSQAYVADIELGTEIMRGQGLVWINSFDVEMSSR